MFMVSPDSGHGKPWSCQSQPFPVHVLDAQHGSSNRVMQGSGDMPQRHRRVVKTTDKKQTNRSVVCGLKNSENQLDKEFLSNVILRDKKKAQTSAVKTSSSLVLCFLRTNEEEVIKQKYRITGNFLLGKTSKILESKH